MFSFINLLVSQGCPGMPEAQGSPSQQACGKGDYTSLIFIVLIFAIFYFLFIRPSQQKQKKHQDMIGNLSKGDRVITQGGIHGKITKIKKDTFKIKIGKDTEIEIEKGLISREKGEHS